MTSNEAAVTASGPVVLTYDGTELAGFVINEAARQLAPGREALVLCVWQPADVGFKPVGERHFDADQASEVRKAAEETAEYGASLAQAAGFRAQSLAVEAAPIWKGIIDTAEERHAGLIVVGSNRHGGLIGHFHGNVAAAVVAHSVSPVLVIHRRA